MSFFTSQVQHLSHMIADDDCISSDIQNRFVKYQMQDYLLCPWRPATLRRKLPLIHCPVQHHGPYRICCHIHRVGVSASRDPDLDASIIPTCRQLLLRAGASSEQQWCNESRYKQTAHCQLRAELSLCLSCSIFYRKSMACGS